MLLAASSRSPILLRVRTMGKSSLLLVLLVSAVATASDVQVLLRSDKTEYEVGEVIRLSYETLWLGYDDGHLRFSSIAFPEVEILHFNRYRVELTETTAADELAAPSRHERATFAPTMSHLSREFAINDPNSPTKFLNGTVGYYKLDSPGVYVIRVLFSADGPWQLFEGQEAEVRSSAIVIKVGK